MSEPLYSSVVQNRFGQHVDVTIASMTVSCSLFGWTSIGVRGQDLMFLAIIEDEVRQALGLDCVPSIRYAVDGLAVVSAQ